MPTLRSSVLVINHPKPETVAFGADFAPDFKLAAEMVSDFAYQVVVVPSELTGSMTELRFLDALNVVAIPMF